MLTDPQRRVELTGECLVLLAGRASGDALGRRLAPGIGRLPGPALLVAVHAGGGPTEVLGRSGIGVFLARWAHLGIRPALSVVTGVVGDDQARVRLQAGMGLPMVTGTLSWVSDGRHLEVSWKEHGLTLRARAGRLTVPAVLAARVAQVRDDGPVLVPMRVGGLARAARATVEVPEDDELMWLAARHRGALLAGGHLVLRPARQPVGLLSSLRAPALGAGQLGRATTATATRRQRHDGGEGALAG